MDRQTRFCTSKDGTRIAYWTFGEGPPLVICPGLVEQFSLLHQVSGWQAYLDRLTAARLAVQYDPRGAGLSERAPTDFSVEARVHDLEAVVEAAGLEQFALYASLLSGPVAITYAARHPERLTHLVLYGTFSRGEDVMPWERLRALLDLARNDWQTGAQLLADMSTRSEHPEAGIEIAAHFRASTSGQAFADGLTQGYNQDAGELLSQIQCPTLVIHRRDDEVVPLASGQGLAVRIPNARFITLDGNVHAEFLGDSGAVLDAIDTFLGRESPPTAPPPTSTRSPALATILFTDIAGSTALTERLGDAHSREVLRQHERITRDVLSLHSGTEVKTMGDGFMASFTSVTRAAECAIALQQAFAERNETAAEALHVRVGLNAGEPIEEEGDLFGTAVNLAARIAARAEAGEVLLPDTVRGLLAGKGFLFADRGDVALRGFEDPVRLYELRWREQT